MEASASDLPPVFRTEIDLGNGCGVSLTVDPSRCLFLVCRSDGEEGEVPFDVMVVMLTLVAAKRACHACGAAALILSFLRPSDPAIVCRGCAAAYVVRDHDLRLVQI